MPDPPKLRHPLNSRVTPGERIGAVLVRGTEKKMLVPGKGTYVRQVSSDAELSSRVPWQYIYGLIMQ